MIKGKKSRESANAQRVVARQAQAELIYCTKGIDDSRRHSSKRLSLPHKHTNTQTDRHCATVYCHGTPQMLTPYCYTYIGTVLQYTAMHWYCTTVYCPGTPQMLIPYCHTHIGTVLCILLVEPVSALQQTIRSHIEDILFDLQTFDCRPSV